MLPFYSFIIQLTIVHTEFCPIVMNKLIKTYVVVFQLSFDMLFPRLRFTQKQKSSSHYRNNLKKQLNK